MMFEVETIVVGAGVVGLAVARALAQSGREVIVLEKNGTFGEETSSRNSEVVHAGIYYAQGSLKAQLCVQGRHQLYQYCQDRGIYCEAIGKLIVATNDTEKDQLSGIAQKARNNGVDDLTEISAEQAKELEPEIACTGALFSPSTGIVDSHNYMLSLLGDFENHGGLLAFNSPFEKAIRINNGFKVHVGGQDATTMNCRELVICAGLYSIGLSKQIEGWAPSEKPIPRFAKGNYFGFKGKVPFARLIYPVPVQGGLGVHLTLDQTGAGKFGPDVEWLNEDRLNPDDFNYAVDPTRSEKFYASIRRYWPGLPNDSLVPDYAGIRPKIFYSNEMLADFEIVSEKIHQTPGLITLHGIESPGLTSSLAIGSYVKDLLSA